MISSVFFLLCYLLIFKIFAVFGQVFFPLFPPFFVACFLKFDCILYLCWFLFFFFTSFFRFELSLLWTIWWRKGKKQTYVGEMVCCSKHVMTIKITFVSFVLFLYLSKRLVLFCFVCTERNRINVDGTHMLPFLFPFNRSIFVVVGCLVRYLANQMA